MDRLGYGLEEPRLALQADGDVLVMGTVQGAPSTPAMRLSGRNMVSTPAAPPVNGTVLTATIADQLSIAIQNGVPDQYTYRISADANGGAPQMPDIPAVLSYSYQTGDIVEWKAVVSYTMPRNASKGDISLRESFPTNPLVDPWTAGVGRKFPQGLLAFLTSGDQLIRGGKLELTARIKRAGKILKVSATVTGIKIIGQNPARASVDANLAHGSSTLSSGITLSGSEITRWLKAIARIETHNTLSQFATVTIPNERYSILGDPFMNHAGDGGMGIMQITRDSRLALGLRWDFLWNWDKNIAQGKIIFDGTIGTASRYSSAIRTQSASFIQAIQRINAWRVSLHQPTLRVNVPEFTARQVMEDAARGYNGFAEKSPRPNWQFGIGGLHEFRVQTHDEPGIGMVLDLQNEGPDPQNPGGLVADVTWIRVLWNSERPDGGDPN